MSHLFVTLLKRPPPLNREEEFVLHTSINRDSVQPALAMHRCPEEFRNEVELRMISDRLPTDGGRTTFRYAKKDGAILSFHVLDLSHHPDDGTDHDC